MPKRSLIASPEGIKKAKSALEHQNLSQKALADVRGIASWSTINHFFNGKPVEREIFFQICEELNLDPQETAAPGEEPLDKLWRQLQTLGSPTEEMGLVVVKEQTLGWGKQKPSKYEKSVRLGSYIQVKIDLSTPGYLILLQKDTSGEVYCFCPSCFAPQFHLHDGKTILPQQDSPITAFPLEGEPGREEILAVIFNEPPKFDWLPEGSDDPLQLEENHLNDLTKHINNNGTCKVFYTNYTLTK
ncbi:MAG: DUF4384 domain-containing protein [Scytonematopsis contorta HA4267-MV1]|jgi:DNA-binding Xre family transcriptional regulator|nr:DUF4384 domain-containing protein [Scytonematopsis contorta HA4267-MV1]